MIYQVNFLHLVSVLQLDLRHMNQLPTNNSIGIAMDLRFQININLTVSGLCCHSSHNYIQSKSIFLKTHGIIVTFAFLLKCFGCFISNGIAITMSTRRWTPPLPSFSFQSNSFVKLSNTFKSKGFFLGNCRYLMYFL